MYANRDASIRPDMARQRGAVVGRQDCWRLQLLKAVRSMALAYVQDTLKYKQIIEAAKRCGFLT
jgi:hypothetical protein